jgi:hypothetical protein
MIDLEIKNNKTFDSFVSKVEINFDNISGCWDWKAFKNPDGYGMFKVNGIMRLAHRVAYQNFVRSGDHKVVMHICDNPKCVNPTHLIAGTQKDNMKDRLFKGRYVSPTKDRKECINGHPYTNESVRIDKIGKYKVKACRICTRIANKRRQDKRY